MNKKLLDPVHPGEILFEDFMKPSGISINGLARALQIPPTRVSEIVNGKRAITSDTALRLGVYFGISPEVWTGLQMDHDMEIAKRKSLGAIRKQIKPLSKAA